MAFYHLFVYCVFIIGLCHCQGNRMQGIMSIFDEEFQNPSSVIIIPYDLYMSYEFSVDSSPSSTYSISSPSSLVYNSKSQENHKKSSASHNKTKTKNKAKSKAKAAPKNHTVTKIVVSTQSVVSTRKITTTQKVTATKTVIVSEEDQIDKRMKSCYRKKRKVDFSKYWIPKENEWDENNEGKRVFLGGDKKTKILDKKKKVLATVGSNLYNKCKMEGTCLLENGDLINIDNSTSAFMKVGGKGREHNVFGLGSGDQNLVPFISIAANDIPIGQKLYIAQLDGVDLGSGIKHNGCVRVDDDSWSFDSCQIDFFVLSYVDYLWLDLAEKVTVRYSDDCELKNYINKHHMVWAKASSKEKIIHSLLNAKHHK